MNHQQQQLLHHPQAQRRRQSLLNRRVQEEMLIEQVKIRPVLYDKSLKAYRKPGATENAWMQIADAFTFKGMTVSVDDCRKRWKSLRDTFIKYFRQELLAASAPGMKRKRWIYYEQMCFLRSHVELFGNGHYYSIAETDSASDKEEAMEETIISDDNQLIQMEHYVSNDFLEYEDTVEDQNDDNETEYVYEDVEPTSPTISGVQEANQSLEEVDPVVESETTIVQEDLLEQEKPNIIAAITHHEGPAETVSSSCPTAAITDPDERFLLSCAPVLKRLSIQKNALVKLKIQQLLYDVEFGDGRK